MTTKLKILLEFISKERISRSPKSLIWYFENLLFNGIEMKNKKVLDIGGGIGMASFYSAACNATSVDLLEPLGDGSGSVAMEKFLKMINGMPEFSKKINHINKPFQEWKTNMTKYDIIVLHNSINHLNEEACINMLIYKNAWNEYLNYFLKFFELLNNGGVIVIADCTNVNFFNTIGMKSPLTRTIEWHKHQKPETWSQILMSVGFSNPKITWTSFKQLRSIGKILLANKIVSYFLMSHFIIQARKSHKIIENY